MKKGMNKEILRRGGRWDWKKEEDIEMGSCNGQNGIRDYRNNE